MKLLIDNNLSHRLSSQLQTNFPGSDHIRNVLTVVADDDSIWTYAKANKYVILTKDNDFNELALLRGCPPKIIQLLCGNVSTSHVFNLLNEHTDAIINFIKDDSPDCLLKIFSEL